MIRQYELVEKVRAYDPGVDEEALNRAYVYSMVKHGSQTRASGDPYFMHPLEVAGILTDYKLDGSSIITALLHDTVEDTDATIEEIQRLFGPEVGRLVDGVTKLSQIELQSETSASKQAENFRKLVLAMSEDIRVLLVKLADRLHNMRTLHFIENAEKRGRISRETMDIYAPLAERIGMHEVKDELQDLAFRELNPDARRSILARLDFLRTEGGDLVERILRELPEVLAGEQIEARVNGREKRPYSIWTKMEHKNVGFEQLSDIMAFRVVVADIQDCYAALGVIHSRYQLVPGRFKDYISVPKPNGYRSIHTTVFGPERQRIEIQIRTPEMHEIAELGVAAHWRYKQDDGALDKGKVDGRQYRWLRELLDVLEHASGPEEFLEHTKLDMFHDQVFCFSPKGDLIALPRGATPVDFAYAVHSDIGDTCAGVKVNGRMMPLRTELENGDQVEVVTSKAQTPSPEWERFVKTGKARACIRRFIRNEQREQYLGLGRSIVEKAFRAAGQDFSVKGIEGVLKAFRKKTVDDLYAAVGEGLITGRDVVAKVYPETRKGRAKSANGVVPRPRKAASANDTAISIRGLIPGMAVHYAGCCHPVPGDRIVGIVTTGKGVTIHTIDCDTLESFHDQPERWLDVTWSADPEELGFHVGRLSVVLNNEPGSLGGLTTIIGRNEGNISNLKFTRRDADFYEMLIDIEVRDLRHLTDIVAALRASPTISSVRRARS